MQRLNDDLSVRENELFTKLSGTDRIGLDLQVEIFAKMAQINRLYKGTKYEGEDYENVVCHLFEEIIKYEINPSEIIPNLKKVYSDVSKDLIVAKLKEITAKLRKSRSITQRNSSTGVQGEVDLTTCTEKLGTASKRNPDGNLSSPRKSTAEESFHGRSFANSDSSLMEGVLSKKPKGFTLNPISTYTHLLASLKVLT